MRILRASFDDQSFHDSCRNMFFSLLMCLSLVCAVYVTRRSCLTIHLYFSFTCIINFPFPHVEILMNGWCVKKNQRQKLPICRPWHPNTYLCFVNVRETNEVYSLLYTRQYIDGKQYPSRLWRRYSIYMRVYFIRWSNQNNPCIIDERYVSQVRWIYSFQFIQSFSLIAYIHSLFLCKSQPSRYPKNGWNRLGKGVVFR